MNAKKQIAMELNVLDRRLRQGISRATCGHWVTRHHQAPDGRCIACAVPGGAARAEGVAPTPQACST